MAGKWSDKQLSERLTLFSDFDATHRNITREQMISMHRNLQTFEESMEAREMPEVPTDDDYAFFPFRHLSKTTVGAGSFQATDFAKGNVLRDAVPLLSRVPAYTNHMIWVGNEIGVVGEAEWQNKTTNTKGEDIPAGINAPFVIDRKLYPNLVRKLNSLYGSPIDSASVTVGFIWEPSHDFEHPEDFYWHLGEVLEDNMVRRIVSSIEGFEESSLVWSGADPYAKYLDNKKLVPNPDVYRTIEGGRFKNERQAKEAWYQEFLQQRHYFVMDSEQPQRVQKFSLRLHKTPHNKYTDVPTRRPGSAQTKISMNEKILILLAAQLGTTTEQLSEEMLNDYAFMKKEDKRSLESKVQNATVMESKVQTLEQERDQIKEQLNQLTQQRAEEKTFTEFGKKHLALRRDEAKKLYTKFTNGEPKEAILKSIDSWDIETLEASMESWGGSLLEKYGAHVVDGKVKFTKAEKTTRGEDRGAPSDYVPFGFPA